MPEEETYPAAPEGSVRLNKFLASCGYESRRAADKLIEEGRVEVNGQRVETPGLRVMPTDFVKVDGHHATPKEVVTLLLNKPRGFVCSRDAQGAAGTVFDLLPPKYRYVNYAGRLDGDSEGLLLLTNNGELLQNISHPKGGIEKEYWVTLDQAFDGSVLIQLLKGLHLPEGQAKAKYVSRLSARRACVVLEQGLKRQVRQMFACLGLRVKKLVRVRIGSLWGGDLEPGHCAMLTEEQIAQATTNPPRRKGLMGAQQVFKPRTAPVKQDAPAAEADDDDYVFNPADFETEEEALGTATKYSEGESFEPERPQRGARPFGRVPFAARRNGERAERGERSYGERRERSFGGERRGGFANRGNRSFGNRRFNRDGGERRERSFGERRERNFGERRERTFGDRGERPFGERRERSFGERKFDRNNGGERRERNFGERRGFGERRERSFGERSFGERKFGRNNFGGNRRGGSFVNRGGRSFGGPRGGRSFGSRRRED